MCCSAIIQGVCVLAASIAVGLEFLSTEWWGFVVLVNIAIDSAAVPYSEK